LSSRGFSAGNDYPLYLGPWVPGGFVPLFLGLGLILLHFFAISAVKAFDNHNAGPSL